MDVWCDGDLLLLLLQWAKHVIFLGSDLEGGITGMMGINYAFIINMMDSA